MKKIKLYHDKKGNTLTVWFDDPRKEYICDEIEDDVVIMKDRKGEIIGFEKLNYIIPSSKNHTTLPIEVISA